MSCIPILWVLDNESSIRTATLEMIRTHGCFVSIVIETICLQQSSNWSQGKMIMWANLNSINIPQHECAEWERNVTVTHAWMFVRTEQPIMRLVYYYFSCVISKVKIHFLPYQEWRGSFSTRCVEGGSQQDDRTMKTEKSCHDNTGAEQHWI